MVPINSVRRTVSRARGCGRAQRLGSGEDSSNVLLRAHAGYRRQESFVQGTRRKAQIVPRLGGCGGLLAPQPSELIGIQR